MHYIVKRQVTLIEMMIVMFLIALIIGVLAYNYQGALEEGKAFKTKAGMEKIQTILTLSVSQNPNAADNLESNWKELIRQSPLVQNPDDLIRDGWGEDYQVSYENGKITVSSKRLNDYQKK